MPSNVNSASSSFVQGTSNPFMTHQNHKTYSVNAPDFVPSATAIASTLNNIFTPSINSDSTTDDSRALSNTQDEKYKTEMCKNWIENRTCRYGKKCQFAHGYDELATF